MPQATGSQIVRRSFSLERPTSWYWYWKLNFKEINIDSISVRFLAIGKKYQIVRRSSGLDRPTSRYWYWKNIKRISIYWVEEVKKLLKKPPGNRGPRGASLERPTSRVPKGVSSPPPVCSRPETRVWQIWNSYKIHIFIFIYWRWTRSNIWIYSPLVESQKGFPPPSLQSAPDQRLGCSNMNFLKNKHIDTIKHPNI